MSDVKWSDDTAFTPETHINPTDTVMGLLTSGAGGNVKYVTPIVQTTGSVTSGHLLVYGSDGSIAKDCGVNVDTNQNVYANNLIGAYTTTATAGSTTTLTVASAYNQYFTGSTTQTVQLPVTSTLSQGFSFYIVNTSTMNVTVESSGGNIVQVMAPNSAVTVTCILTTGTTAASWYADAQGVGTDLFPNGYELVTSSTQTIANGTAYGADAGGIVTFTLPAAVVGTYFAIIGINGWQLNLATGQVVTIGNITANGSSVSNWQSTHVNDAVIFLCIGSNSWQSVSLSGNPATSQGVTALSTGLMPKVTVVSSTQAMSPNTSYFCNNGAGLITFTLPTTLNSIQSSTRVAVYGNSSGSAGGWKINYGSGVQIFFGNNSSTASSGNMQSTTAGDWAVLDYIGGNWQVTAFGGAPMLDTGGTLLGLTKANSAQLVTNSSGTPVMTASMTNGQVIIGSTGSTPIPGTLTAGAGIAITNGAGTITLSTTSVSTNVNQNVIYSGNFDTNPWQAGTSFAAIANDSIIADGWKWFQTGTGVVTAAINANAPTFAQAGMFLTNSMGITVTTADTSITSTKLYHITHTVEGIDWTQVYQQAMTLSFWVYATVTGIHCISISNNATTRCFIAEYTVAVTNTWQFVVINIPADSTGTWLLTPGTIGAFVSFANAIGSAAQASSGWGSTFGYSTSNQVNDMGTNGNVFAVDLVYLQAGTFSSPVYPYEDFSQVLRKSQRFYYKTYDQGIYPGSSNANGTVSLVISSTTTAFGKDMQFKQTMAITPTITIYDNAGTSGKWYIGSSGQSATVDGIGMNGIRIYGSNGSGATTMQGHFVANSYLF